MPHFIIYFLKVSAALAVMYLFYQFVLRRLTFYNWNRWYLLGYSLLAFIIPFTNISSLLQKNELQQHKIIKFVPSFPQGLIVQEKSFQFTTANILWLLFLAGVAVMVIRTMIQFASLYRLQQKAFLLNEEGVKLFHVNENIIPFSFYNAIYLNSHLHTEEDLNKIIEHEFVHIKQKHSIDILLGELLCIVLWFNPFAWLMRYAIRQNLEFAADQEVLNNGLDKKQYQYLLLKVIGNNHYSVVSNFNFSSLKNRITMMNKLKSAKLHLIKFLFVLPLLAVLLVSFRDKIYFENTNRIFEEGGSYSNDVFAQDEIKLQQTDPNYHAKDSIPNHQLPANVQQVEVKKSNGEEKISIKLKNGNVEIFDLKDQKQKELFEKKYGYGILPPLPPAAPSLPSDEQWAMATNKKIKAIHVTRANGQNKMEITLKNGTTESYDLNDPKQKAAFENKYGELKEPPSPPALTEVPVAAESPAATVNISTAPLPPSAVSMQEIPVAPLQPVVLNSKGYYLSIADNQGECVIIVKDKNKKIAEAIKLTDWNANEQQYEKKYGKLPPPPPPAPAVNGIVADTVEVSVIEDEVLPGITYKVFGSVAPLYVVDGKVIEGGNMNSIDPNSIAHINVLKGTSATTLYGEKGVNGVVEVKTKNADIITKAEPKLNITTKGIAGGWPSGALYFIDGKEATAAEVEKLNRDLIKRISVLKDKSAVKVYGEKGRKGAVLIITKTKAATNSKQIYDKLNFEPE